MIGHLLIRLFICSHDSHYCSLSFDSILHWGYLLPSSREYGNFKIKGNLDQSAICFVSKAPKCTKSTYGAMGRAFFDAQVTKIEYPVIGLFLSLKRNGWLSPLLDRQSCPQYWLSAKVWRKCWGWEQREVYFLVISSPIVAKSVGKVFLFALSSWKWNLIEKSKMNLQLCAEYKQNPFYECLLRPTICQKIHLFNVHHSFWQPIPT